jgi:uncharacterized membrane protein HdeD (DUF308 family)
MSGNASRILTLVFLTVLAALCIWHAFKGRQNNLSEEFRTSVILGIATLLVGLITVFRPRVHFELLTILVGTLYLLAAVYYVHTALKEHHLLCEVRAD